MVEIEKLVSLLADSEIFLVEGTSIGEMIGAWNKTRSDSRGESFGVECT